MPVHIECANHIFNMLALSTVYNVFSLTLTLIPLAFPFLLTETSH